MTSDSLDLVVAMNRRETTRRTQFLASNIVVMSGHRYDRVERSTVVMYSY